MVSQDALFDALHKLPSVNKLQNEIGRIPGVIVNRVIMMEQRVGAVHILADARIDVARVAFDVKTLLKKSYGVELERRRISIALLRRPDRTKIKGEQSQLKTGNSKLFESAEIRLRPMEKAHVQSIIHDEEKDDTVQVTLRFEGLVVHGQAESGGPFVNEVRMAAEATLDAYEKYLQQWHWMRFGERCRLILKDLVPFDLSGTTGFLSGVVLLTEENEVQLAGSALAKMNDMYAAAGAVCNAVDRYVSADDKDNDDLTYDRFRLHGQW